MPALFPCHVSIFRAATGGCPYGPSMSCSPSCYTLPEGRRPVPSIFFAASPRSWRIESASCSSRLTTSGCWSATLMLLAEVLFQVDRGPDRFSPARTWPGCRPCRRAGRRACDRRAGSAASTRRCGPLRRCPPQIIEERFVRALGPRLAGNQRPDVLAVDLVVRAASPRPGAPRSAGRRSSWPARGRRVPAGILPGHQMIVGSR